MWWIVGVAALVNVYIGREFAVLIGVHMPGARLSRRRAATALSAFGLELAFFLWNRTTGTFPFTVMHAMVLAVGMSFGFQQVNARRRALTKDINVLSSGVVAAFAHPFSDRERVRQLLKTVAQSPLLVAKLQVGIPLVGARDGSVPFVKVDGDELVDVSQPGSARPTSPEERVDLLLQELGGALLACLGHGTLPKESMEVLSPRDLAFLERSNARTWALLDPTSFDWTTLNEALYRVSEVRLRRGIPEGALTAIERRSRADRQARRSAREQNRRDSAERPPSAREEALSPQDGQPMDSAAARNIEAFQQAMRLHEELSIRRARPVASPGPAPEGVPGLRSTTGVDAQAMAAARSYDEAFEVCLREHNSRAAAIVLFYHGRLLELMGQLSEAEGKFREALGIIESSPTADLSQQQAETACLYRLGVVVGRRGAYNEAREFLERALHICEALYDAQGRSAVLAALDAVFK